MNVDTRTAEIAAAIEKANERRAKVEALLDESALYEDAMMEALRDRGYQVTEDNEA